MKATQRRGKKATALHPTYGGELIQCSAGVLQMWSLCGALSQHVRAEEREGEGKKENVGPTLLFAAVCSTYGGRDT